MNLAYKHFYDTINLSYVTILVEASYNRIAIMTSYENGYSRDNESNTWVSGYMEPFNERNYKNIEWHDYTETV